MYNCKRRRLRTTGGDEWNFGCDPFRMTISRPAQRRTNHGGGKRIFDENIPVDCKRVESHGRDLDSTQNQNGIAARGNQFFNMTSKTFYYDDSLNLHNGSEYTKQTPLKEITMNCRRPPVFKYDSQDIPVPKYMSGGFVYGPTNVNEQEPSDLFGDASYRRPQSFDVSPAKFSDFSKDSSFFEFSSHSSSTNDFFKFSARNYHCLEDIRGKSLECLNVSTHPVEKPWSDICRYQVKSITAERSVGPYPETPESSRERISSPESVCRRMSLLNEDFRDLSDDALQIPPMQVMSSQFNFPGNVSPYCKSSPLPLAYEKRSDFFQVQERTDRHPNMHCHQKFEPCLTDPDEEYAKMKSNSVRAKLSCENFRFSPH